MTRRSERRARVARAICRVAIYNEEPEQDEIEIGKIVDARWEGYIEDADAAIRAYELFDKEKGAR